MNPNDLLTSVAAKIREAPDCLDMTNWLDKRGPCACIAGHIILEGGSVEQIKTFKENHYRGSQIASQLLGLDEKATKKLFYLNLWPNKVKNQFALARTTQERADIAALWMQLFAVDNQLKWE